VNRVRLKLADSPYRYVHTHRGIGYRFAPVQRDDAPA
jgi:DNA-binding response OmpR family regulator